MEEMEMGTSLISRVLAHRMQIYGGLLPMSRPAVEKAKHSGMDICRDLSQPARRRPSQEV